MRTSLWVLALLLGVDGAAFAEEVRPVVAVFDVELDGLEMDAEAVGRLSAHMTDRISATGFFRVVPRAELRARLREKQVESYEACFDESCQIELGKELAANKTIATRIRKIAGRCTVSATVFDLRRSATDLSSLHTDGCDRAALIASLDVVAEDLFSKRTAVLTPEQRARYLQEARNSIPHGQKVSPYFFVLSDDPDRDRLPLAKTEVKMDVAGMIADVRVTQTYKNEGNNALEALYVFPVSERAAISEMRMTIGERVVEAKIQEKGQARRTYEKAREGGRSAALLEQMREGVYQMSVANILPGDDIKVEYRYSELLVPERGTYALAYPVVSAPRYASKIDASSVAQARNPFLSQSLQTEAPVEVTVSLRSGIPISSIVSPSHPIDIRYTGPTTAEVKLKEQKPSEAFLLRYQLSAADITSGAMLFPGKEESFFLVMMEPPKSVDPSAIVPREYVFVVDVSGSMRGFPIETSKKLMRNLLSGLRANEHFNVILFAGGNELMSPRSVVANDRNINRAFDLLDRQTGGGGTNLLPALKRALDLPQAKKGVSRTVVVVTDGEIRATSKTLSYVRSELDDANVFAFGIGRRVNKPVIEGIARAGMGEPFVVQGPNEAQAISERFQRYVSSPVTTDLRYRFAGFDAYDIEPPALGDLFAERPVVLFGKYRGQAKGSVLLTGISGSGEVQQRLKFSRADSSEANRALSHLWARHRIQRYLDLERVGDNRKSEIVELGVKYSLATKYTSFVAEDHQVRTKPTEQRLAQVTEPTSRRRKIDVAPQLLEEVDSPEDDHRSGISYGGASEKADVILAMREDRGGFGLTISLEPVTALAGQGRTLLDYASVDLLYAPRFGPAKLYVGLGMGVFAPRFRAGTDLDLGLGFFARAGLRTQLSLQGGDQQHLLGFLGEAGLGWRFGLFRQVWSVSGMYLPGVGLPIGEQSDRTARFVHGGALALAWEY